VAQLGLRAAGLWVAEEGLVEALWLPEAAAEELSQLALKLAAAAWLREAALAALAVLPWMSVQTLEPRLARRAVEPAAEL
jgi:hypothetical protein